MNVPSARIFVYGTLKEGFPNHHLISGRRLGGVYRTRLAYPFYVVKLVNEDRAPWLIDSPGLGCRVTGEVFEVDASTLQDMDSFEEVGRPDGYVRVEIDLEELGDARTRLRAHAYLKPADQLARCLEKEGPFEAYTHALAVGYRLASG